MRKQLTLYFLLLTLTFCLWTCEANDPPIPPPPVEDKIGNTITITELWRDLDAIQIKFNKSSLDSVSLFSYYLFVNGIEQKTFTNLKSDTTYTHAELTEGTEYSYQVKAFMDTELKDTSKTVNMRTLSTTSHEIEWTVDTLGVPGELLTDVWGLDENNVWAIGAVTLSGERTGVIKWDGKAWNRFPSFPGSKSGIFGFAENNIWVVTSGTYGEIGNWNGTDWQIYSFFPPPLDTVWGLNAVWGSSPEDVWAVGDRGTIVHWDGVEWKKVASPLKNDSFRDVWGSSSDNIYAVSPNQLYISEVIHYNGTEWKDVTDYSFGNRNLITVWVDKSGKAIAAGNRVVDITMENWQEINMNIKYGVVTIRGKSSADIFVGGEYGMVYHYNGTNWKSYDELLNESSYGYITGISIFDNKIFMTGRIVAGQQRALIYKGERKSGGL